MATHTLAITLLAVTLGLFVWGRWRCDMVAIMALLAAVGVGLVPAERAFAGFGHPAVVTVAAILVASRGLSASGAVDLLSRPFVPRDGATTRHAVALVVLAALLSAVMNNVGALALLLPVAVASASGAGRVLMPMSFASMLGGLVTLIGTPPNIIVSSYRGMLTGTPFGMFDFAMVGGGVALVGIVYLVTVGWRLLPRTARQTPATPVGRFDVEPCITEFRLAAASDLSGQPLATAIDRLDRDGAELLSVVRDGRRIDHHAADRLARPDDLLVVKAVPETLGILAAALGAERIGTLSADDALKAGQATVMEAVVRPASAMEGRTAAALCLPEDFDVNLVAVSRAGHASPLRLGAHRFAAGDVLLLHGDEARLRTAGASLGWLPLAGRAPDLSRRRPWATLLLFAAAVAAAAAGASPAVAFTAAAVGMIAVGAVPARDVYTSIDWRVVVLLAALIPVGGAFETAGLAEELARALAGVSVEHGPAVALALVLIVTMCLSDVLNNAATAVLMAPVAAGVAAQLGVSADPFLMAVAIGASCAFLTPIGHQNNLLVMGPGGYRFGDYGRMGLPLEILVAAVAVPLLLWAWPLHPAP